jgi:hypothetical protein
MQIKDGVVLAGLDIRMRPALMFADAIWKEYGQELVVTSALDGVHSAGSLHYYGLALDFRIYYFSPEEALAVSVELRECLGTDFDVVLHSTHIHVEYDPR